MQPWEYTASFDPLGDVLPESVLAKLRDQSQVDFDIGFYAHVLTRAPDCIEILRCQGELLARKGEYERAVAIDLHLVSLCPDDPGARYNLACSLARCGRVKKSLTALKKALKLGYDDWEHLTIDADLDALRELPEYHALLTQYGVGDQS